MSEVPVLVARREWWCPHCTRMEVTPDRRTNKGEVRVRLHQCAGMQGAYIPMLQRNQKAHVSIEYRQDYVGEEVGLRYDAERRPVMAAHVETNNVQSTWVFPGVALLRGEGQ